MKSSLSKLFILFIFSISFGQHAFAVTSPDPAKTPGVLCTKDDPNFKGYDYPEHIARCNRNVNTNDKLKIAAEYGNIPQSEWPQYEFDHMIPLCAGGSDDIKNLWPQPITEAHQKDVLENNICLAMQAGTLTQAQAVQKVRDWFSGKSAAMLMSEQSLYLDETYSIGNSVTCKTDDSTVVHFSIIGPNEISNASVNLVDADGEHEAIKAEHNIGARKINARKSLLKGFVRYVLNQKSSDHMEMMLPNNLSNQETQFIGYLKVGFEDSYPALKPLRCVQN